MQDKKETLESTSLCRLVVNGMLEKKGSNVTVLDLRKVNNAVADYFVICSGGSDTQIGAIADSVEDEVRKELELRPWKNEGKQNKEWILIDYVDVVVHIFSKDKRGFFALEKLWGDAVITQEV